jgi:hypothetical protein
MREQISNPEDSCSSSLKPSKCHFLTARRK